VSARTSSWPSRSHLFVLGDDIGWSIDEDARVLEATARRLGYDVAPSRWARFARRQAVFCPSHFTALEPRWSRSSHRLGLAYFHGRPGTPGYPEFAVAFERLRRDPGRVARVQVTHEEMRDVVVAAGVDPARVFTVRLDVDRSRFHARDSKSRRLARAALGVPESAFVVGSFQKDGVGLGEGAEPKLIKWPRHLLATLARLREEVPELFVVLTGLARGYVRSGLERLGIAHRHVLFDSLDDLAGAYHALDAYVVTSRQEGGPKGPLEAMATGVPVVTTRVGQVQEIVEDGQVALLEDVEDADALAGALLRVHDDRRLRQTLSRGGHEAAARHDQRRLTADWGRLLDGFVEHAAEAPSSQAREP
jgi:glycosyltransferase involved in cell wall biosynthesis